MFLTGGDVALGRELGTADTLAANGDSPPPTRRSANSSTDSAPKNNGSVQAIR